jgi:hypothetical protein
MWVHLAYGEERGRIGLATKIRKKFPKSLVSISISRKDPLDAIPQSFPTALKPSTTRESYSSLGMD